MDDKIKKELKDAVIEMLRKNSIHVEDIRIDKDDIIRMLQRVFIPTINNPEFNLQNQIINNPEFSINEKKMDHEILNDYIESVYDKDMLNSNVARIINKTTPQNPDKSSR